MGVSRDSKISHRDLFRYKQGSIQLVRIARNRLQFFVSSSEGRKGRRMAQIPLLPSGFMKLRLERMTFK